jgi:hypothetical protein
MEDDIKKEVISRVIKGKKHFEEEEIRNILYELKSSPIDFKSIPSATGNVPCIKVSLENVENIEKYLSRIFFSL